MQSAHAALNGAVVPIAKQNVVDAHPTEVRIPSQPRLTGRFSLVQLEPSNSAMAGCAALVSLSLPSVMSAGWSSPTAKHEFILGHARLANPSNPPAICPSGCGTARHDDPFHLVKVRHEAPCIRRRVRDPPLWAVAAVR